MSRWIRASRCLGIAYYSLGEYDKAIEHHTQALAISREISNCRLDQKVAGLE